MCAELWGELLVLSRSVAESLIQAFIVFNTSDLWGGFCEFCAVWFSILGATQTLLPFDEIKRGAHQPQK